MKYPLLSIEKSRYYATYYHGFIDTFDACGFDNYLCLLMWEINSEFRNFDKVKQDLCAALEHTIVRRVMGGL